LRAGNGHLALDKPVRKLNLGIRIHQLNTANWGLISCFPQQPLKRLAFGVES
jgi:hypothetical protein